MWILVIITVLTSRLVDIQALSDTSINETTDAIIGGASNVFIDGFDNAFFSAVNELIHPVLLLLRIQTETCGLVRWCTIDVETNRAKKTCCKACSCDASCKDGDSCCPDYDFGKLNNWPKYGSVSAFVDEFLMWANLTKGYNDSEQTVEYNGTATQPQCNRKLCQFNNDQYCTKQCVRPQVQKSSKLRQEAGAFYMTAKCLSDDIDPDVKKRCEFDYYNNPVDPDNLPSFDDLTPVQSLVDGTIYKNKYCSACSAHDQETRPWTASALCVQSQLPDLEVSYFPSPNSILRTLLIYMLPQTSFMVKFSMCNIIFEPSNDQEKVIQHHKCTKYDFEGCENNPNATVESEPCERYSSPVHIYSDDNDRTLTVYKNAACLSCLESSVTHRECSYAYASRRIKMNMFVPREMAKISATEHVEGMLYEAFPGDPKHGCIRGEIYDATSDICRRVFCPRGMFAFQGKCHYFFTQINGGAFVVLLKLIPTSSTVNDTDFAISIFDDLALYDENDPMVSIADLSVWRWPSTGFLVYLAISLNDTNATYSDAINFVRYIVMSPQSWANTKMAPGSTLDVSIASSVMQEFRRFLDMRTGEYISLVFPEKYRVKQLKVKFEIGEVHFCYRLRMTVDDYEYIQDRRAIKLKSSGAVVYQKTSYPVLFDTKFLVCMKRVLDGNKKDTHADNNVDFDAGDDDDDHDDHDDDDGPVRTFSNGHTNGASTSRETLEMGLAPGILAFVGLVVLVTCKMRRRQTEADIERSHRQELPTAEFLNQQNTTEPTIHFI